MARTTLQYFRNETDVGLDDVLLNASNNSNELSCRGMNQCTIVVDHHTHASTFTLTFYVEGSIDEGDTWFRLQIANEASGVMTLNDASYSKSMAATGVFAVEFPINYTNIRIKALTGSSNAGDKADVNVQFGSI